ncbi:thermonuclease family protein [Cyanobium sp. N5-Cardenillas]|uniref:thermonuclease family protein n=1 Tax=Cyanobium sp. N5-Cardenillas TaxID=2823720 RepID=UPI0020CE6D02|nr:thermonuclease family protein [Cyanobium sp. N5-Cardenillas]MCP9787204.1 thermonuclease family protein [Cyanobium sp. N5-Cardenillas]
MERKLPSLSRALALCASVLLLAGPAAAATVVSVGDGDTLRVEDGGKKVTIRLACIDAPETAQAPYGMASRRLLQEIAPIGATVQLVMKDRDRYGRTVADILRNGQSLNLRMVRSGQAFAYRQYLAKCDAAAYLKAEREAERARLGVWADPGGITRPWDFRRGLRTGSASTSKPSGQNPVRTTPPRAMPTGVRYRCSEIGSFAKAQQLLREGHTYLDRDGDGVACQSLR